MLLLLGTVLAYLVVGVLAIALALLALFVALVLLVIAFLLGLLTLVVALVLAPLYYGGVTLFTACLSLALMVGVFYVALRIIF